VLAQFILFFRCCGFRCPAQFRVCCGSCWLLPCLGCFAPGLAPPSPATSRQHFAGRWDLLPATWHPKISGTGERPATISATGQVASKPSLAFSSPLLHRGYYLRVSTRRLRQWRASWRVVAQVSRCAGAGRQIGRQKKAGNRVAYRGKVRGMPAG
jgi:hypothetical protein